MSIDTKIARLTEHVFARPYKSIDELIGRITDEGPIGMRAVKKRNRRPKPIDGQPRC
jgi:hypothetical protein